MTRVTARSSGFVFTLVFIAASLAAAQSEARYDLTFSPQGNSSWQVAQKAAAGAYKLSVITIDHPDRGKPCRLKSFMSDQLVCARFFGRPQTYRFDQVIAIVLPGDGGYRLPIWLALNTGLGAAIWGTVVLIATCPPCAAGTALAAFLLFGAAGAVAYADDVPDRLLYIAPGQELSKKLGYIQP